LILEDDFKWTYGFGNSVFLQRQLNLITGIDVGPLTYQRRNDAIWGENSMWHSFYGQFANDYTPLGVIFLMFLIGFLMSKVWISYFYNNNFFAGSLLPIIFIMIIFIPANNQVFGYIDSLSYFIIVLLLYLKSKYKLSL
jgi:Kef-type K+ transport system membrane component KefB